MAVGRSLTAWEFLSGGLVSLYVALVRPEQYFAVMRSWGNSSTPIVAKAEMIAEAAKGIRELPAEISDRVQKLSNEVKGYNLRRNDIAHGMVIDFSGTETGNMKGWKGCYLIPHPYITTKYTGADNEEPMYRWTSAQILRYMREFDRLLEQAEQLVLDIDADYSRAASKVALNKGQTPNPS